MLPVSDPAPRAPTVFLSYASQDREAARRLGFALPAFGIEVWYDESELGGGDAWDRKIRQQIRECDYFMPLISAQTEARREGYFRREWRLAVERTLDMADDHPFLLPVVIDDTDATRARVPEKFFAVQWLRVPDGAPNPAIEALCRRLTSSGILPNPAPPAAVHPLSQDAAHGAGNAPNAAAANAAAASAAAANAGAPSANAAYSAPGQGSGSPPLSGQPPLTESFPVHQPGQGVRFGFEVLIWSLRNLWVLFKRLPRWIRYVVTVWLMIALFSHGSSRRQDQDDDLATQAKLKAVAEQYAKNPKDMAKLGATVAKQFADAVEEDNTVSLLAMPFTAPVGDAEAAKLADAAFAQTYTRISLTQRGAPVAGDSGVTKCDLKTLVARAEAKHTRYVLCGNVAAVASAPAALTIALIDAKAAQEIWSGSYPLSGADPAKIGEDVAAQVPKAASDD
jgi:TolB-like protein